MEQRWQDLASLLSLPAQEAAAAGGMTHAHQQMLAASAAPHPAYPYGAAAYGPPGHPAHHPDMARSVLLQNASLAPPPPPPPAAPAAVSAADLVTNGSTGYTASGGMGQCWPGERPPSRHLLRDGSRGSAIDSSYCGSPIAPCNACACIQCHLLPLVILLQ